MLKFSIILFTWLLIINLLNKSLFNTYKGTKHYASWYYYSSKQN